MIFPCFLLHLNTAAREEKTSSRPNHPTGGGSLKEVKGPHQNDKGLGKEAHRDEAAAE